MPRSSPRLQSLLLILFTAYFVLSLRDPPYDLHVVIHIVPTWLAIGALFVSSRLRVLSNTDLSLVVAFLALHVLGTRYIYSYVPYDDWSAQLFGVTITDTYQLSRNHYDRFVHFCYGLFLAPVARQIYVRFSRIQPGWSYLAAVEFVLQG